MLNVSFKLDNNFSDCGFIKVTDTDSRNYLTLMVEQNKYGHWKVVQFVRANINGVVYRRDMKDKKRLEFVSESGDISYNHIAKQYYSKAMSYSKHI